MLSHIIIDLRTVVDESWKIKDITLYGIKVIMLHHHSKKSWPTALQILTTLKIVFVTKMKTLFTQVNDESCDESCEDEAESDND